MAVFQVIHHFSMLALARTIDTLMPDKLMKRELTTRSMRSTLRSESSILDNLPVVMEIQDVNPFAEEVRKRFAEEVGKMMQEDPEVLCRQLRNTKRRISTLIRPSISDESS
jgi:hypothetical protein